MPYGKLVAALVAASLSGIGLAACRVEGLVGVHPVRVTMETMEVVNARTADLSWCVDSGRINQPLVNPSNQRNVYPSGKP